MKALLKTYTMGDIQVSYLKNEKNQVELVMYPKHLEQSICWDKSGEIDSLVQVMLDGDASVNGFSAGHTMHSSSGTDALRFVEQQVYEEERQTQIVTVLSGEGNLEYRHILSYIDGEQGIHIQTSVENKGITRQTMLMLSSFSLGMLTPFDASEAPDTMNYYRIRSRWSSEGRIESGPIEDLQLDPSWARHGISVERFGQVGSMPVRKFYPFAAIEDAEKSVFWAAELACGSSWQMEWYRKDENLIMSGGIADFEFGHWKKNLAAGEVFTTPEAYVTTYQGDFDQTCQRLLTMHRKSVYFRDGNRLPSVFNEYCTTWGNPCEENIREILAAIDGKDFDYFVIDAGWYADDGGDWQFNMGDWIVNRTMFPQGLKHTVDLIRAAGLKPGIWFELETIGKTAKCLNETEHILKRGGKLICSGTRYFWDMRDAWTRAYLHERVTGLLKECGFEYIKIDYNETIGVGCDGAESLGQAMYENILATKEFFNELHEEIPGLVIELCSSGGHRMEPSFLNITDMASFSDAHEEVEIPVIAANVHRVMLPEKNQIWCVIQKEDSFKRIAYSVCATFLGVLCISGTVMTLEESKWKLIEKGIAFYRKLDILIKDGITQFYGTKQTTYRKLKGYQAIVRKHEESRQAYVVIHSFEKNQTIEIDLGHPYQIMDCYEYTEHPVSVNGQMLTVKLTDEYDAVALLLKY